MTEIQRHNISDLNYLRETHPERFMGAFLIFEQDHIKAMESKDRQHKVDIADRLIAELKPKQEIIKHKNGAIEVLQSNNARLSERLRVQKNKIEAQAKKIELYKKFLLLAVEFLSLCETKENHKDKAIEIIKQAEELAK